MSYAKYNGIGGGSSGSGTVTSVGLADGSTTPIFTITGSPVTNSGTLTETLKTQTANTVFAGPTTGAAAQPTFRALVAADISGLVGNLTDAGTDGITITGGTGAVLGSGTSIAQHVADTTHNGYLSSTDWNTFNSKQSALTLGNLTDAGTDGITVTGGTGAVVGAGTSISQRVSDSTHNGYLSSTDWNTFNGKQASGNYITALTGDGTATGPGSVALTLATVNSNVGSFGSASSVATLTANAKGLVTAAGSTSIQIAESQVTNLVSDLAGKQPTGNYITALTGDVTASGPGSVAATIAANAVTNAKAAQMATLTIKGNNTGGTANALDLTVAQVNSMLGSLSNPMTTGGDVIYGGASGVPTRLANGTAGQYLRSAGTTVAPTWATPAIISAWQSYTPTITGLGSTSGLAAKYRQVGSNYEVSIYVVPGTTAAALVSFTLPNASSLDTGSMTVPANTTGAAGQNFGMWNQNGTGTGNNVGFVIAAPGTNAALVYIGQGFAGTGMLIPQNGNVTVASSQVMVLSFCVPISGLGGTTP